MSVERIADLLAEARTRRSCLLDLVDLAASGRGSDLAGAERRLQELAQGFAAFRQQMVECHEERCFERHAGEVATAALAQELEQCRRLVARLEKLIAQAQGIRLSHWRPEPECVYTAGGARPAILAGPRLVRQLA